MPMSSANTILSKRTEDELPDENTADVDLRSTRLQQNTDSESDEITPRSLSEAGNSDFSKIGGNDTIMPDALDKETDVSAVENESHRGGNYNLRPNPTPNFTDEYRY